jgi:serine/threonine protein phosphatase PrpC
MSLPPADIAALSSGGRANGRWKPDNQDAFLVQPTTIPAAAAAAAAGDGGSVQPAAAAAGQGAAIGVFDGHGRLGNAAATIVRQAMSERLAAWQDVASGSGSGDGSGCGDAAGLLDGCFAAAEAALTQSGRDFSKSGCTAVLALLNQDRWVQGLVVGAGVAGWLG